MCFCKPYEGAQSLWLDGIQFPGSMFFLRRLSSRSANASGGDNNSDSGDHHEEDTSRKALDQASDDVMEGKYERALWLLEKIPQLYPGVKGVAELTAVAEVCHAAVQRPCACLVRKHRTPDWYRILKVDEKADFDTIKKRYRHLALLLHPDKNKHVKAEAAFKLVSEAYACLGDEKKRGTFNTERAVIQCRSCLYDGSSPLGSERWTTHDLFGIRKAAFQRADSVPDLNRAAWLSDQEKLRTFRERARARVLGNLAKVWKERMSKGLEEFDPGSESDKRTWGWDWKDLEHRQQRINADETSRRNVKNNQTKSDLNPQAFYKVMNKPRNIPWTLSSDKQGSDHSRQLASRCKTLDTLIRDLRARLVASVGKPSDQDQWWDKSAYAKSKRKSLRSLKNAVPDSSSGLRHTQEKTEVAENTSFKGTRGLLGATYKSTDKPKTTMKQEASCAPDRENHLCSSEGHSHLNDSSFQHPVESKDSIPSTNFESWKFSQVRDSSVASAFSNSREKAEGKLTRPLRRKVSVLDSRGITENDDRVLCEEPMSQRRSSRGDSLDMEEKILQTQKEVCAFFESWLFKKSEQLLKTLERLREETKSVAVSLDRMRHGYNMRIESESFENMLATPTAYHRIPL